MLENEFEYMLHLESDVFPEPDIIESLLFHKKKIVQNVLKEIDLVTNN